MAVTNTAGQPCGYVQLHNATARRSVAQDSYNRSTSGKYELQGQDTQPCVVLKTPEGQGSYRADTQSDVTALDGRRRLVVNSVQHQQVRS